MADINITLTIEESVNNDYLDWIRENTGDNSITIKTYFENNIKRTVRYNRRNEAVENTLITYDETGLDGVE